MKRKNRLKTNNYNWLSEEILRLEEIGRQTFTSYDLEAFKHTKAATQAALRRLLEKGRVINPSRGFFVIVPTRYRSIGSPPANTFIDQWLKDRKTEYYVGLLSAAAQYGAAHHAVQESQIVCNRQFKSFESGAVRVRFFYKKSLKGTPKQKINLPSGSIWVSTPAATAIDLVRYMEKVGGPGAVATIIAELVPKITPDDFVSALKSMTPELSTVQRLAAILETIEPGRYEAAMELATKGTILKYVALNSELQTKKSQLNKKWKVYINDSLETET